MNDIWIHAQNVRMWLATAQESLRRATDTGAGGIVSKILTRGRLSSAHVRDAFDALGKAKLALIDLEFAQHQARTERTTLGFTQLMIERVVDRAAVLAVRDAVDADVETLDVLAASVEAAAGVPSSKRT